MKDIQQIPAEIATPTDTLIVLYEENGRMTRTFLEWRHKVMARFFLALAAIFVLAGWLYKDPTLYGYLTWPFLLVAVLSLAVGLMDHVNSRILNDCYLVGKKLEAALGDADCVYTRMEKGYRSPITYSRVLQIVYFGTAVVAVLVATYLSIRPVQGIAP